MATDSAVLPDHSSSCEKIDKEEKLIEPEKVPLPKEVEASSKTEESATPPVSATPVIEEVEEVDATDEKPNVVVALDEEIAKDTLIEPKGASISEPVVECKSEPENAGKEDLKAELVKEEAKGVDVPEPSSVEAIEGKAEKSEEEVVVPKDAKVFEAEGKSSESSPLAEEISCEQSEVTEPTAKEIPIVEAVKDVDVETKVDKVEDSKLPAEEKAAIEEAIAPVTSDQDKLDATELKVQEKDVECYPFDGISERIGETKEEKEPAKETVEKVVEPGKIEAEEPVQSKEVEGSSEEKVVEPGKIEAETKIPKAIIEENCVPEELVKSEEKPSEGGASTLVPPEILEKAKEEEVISKDIEPVAENGKKDADSKGKLEKEEIKGHEKIDTEEKKDVTAEACETSVEKEKKVDEAAKTEVQKPEPAEDCKEPEKSQDAPKEVPVKTHKQSNNILKKMKNSLIKAKKALVGKSQNSKPSAAAEPNKE